MRQEEAERRIHHMVERSLVQSARGGLLLVERLRVQPGRGLGLDFRTVRPSGRVDSAVAASQLPLAAGLKKSENHFLTHNPGPGSLVAPRHCSEFRFRIWQIAQFHGSALSSAKLAPPPNRSG